MKPNHQIRHERELRGWSQQRVAEVVGTTSRTVSRWELGLSRPYPYFREQLCALFQKNATELGLLDDEELASKQSSTSEATEEYEFSTADKHAISEKKVHIPFSDRTLPDIYDPAIPPPLTGQSGLIGRDELLEQVKEQLQVGEQVAITALNGLPGVGKTALAIAIATDPEIKARFSNGILWAGLGPDADVQGLLRHWGVLLGLGPEDMSGLDGMKAWTIALRRAIGQRRMLLVIDDVWRVEHALALQVGGPLCSYVVTTRLTALAAQIASNGAVVVPELDEEDGIALLKRFIPEIVNQEPETARELVNLVGGLPLAQIIIGRHLHTQSASKQPRRLHRAVEHLRSVEQRLRLAAPASPLARPANLVQESPWSLQAAIAVSDQQLDEQARGALRALAVFPPKPNRFSEEAALAVCQVPVEVLDTLSDSGLLESWGSDYYTLHQTIADYARAQLQDRHAYERLLDYYIEYVRAHQDEWPALLSEDANILNALDAAYIHKLHEKHIQLFSQFVLPALHTKPRDLYEKYVQRAYEASEMVKDVDSIIQVLCHLANIHIMQGELEKAKENLQRALELTQRSEDHPLLGTIYIFRSRLALNICDFQQAEEHARRAVALGQQRQDRQCIYFGYAYLGWAAAYQGKYQDLESYAQEILKRSRHEKSHDFLFYFYCFSAQKKIAEGNYSKAHEYAQESLKCANAMNYHEFAAEALGMLSQSARLQGNYQQAYQYAEEGLGRAKACNHVRSITILHSMRGEVLLAQEKVEEAEAAFCEAQLVAGKLLPWYALTLYGLARVEAKKGNLRIAREYGEKSLEKLTAIGHIEREKVREFVETMIPNAY